MNDAALEVIKRCHDYQIPLARPAPQGEASRSGASPTPPQPASQGDLLGLDHDQPPAYSEDDLLSRDLAAFGAYLVVQCIYGRINFSILEFCL